MIVETIESKGLAHFSYMIISNASAVVIDPRRDITIYEEICKRHSCDITHVFETHRNEDYIIGSVELQEHFKNVQVYHGGEHDYAHGSIIKDGEEISFGEAKIRAIHTPGHTKGHISYLVHGPGDPEVPLMAFTGDLLFAGDTGRTDFYPGEKEEMAGKLYDSIHQKLFPAGDGILLFPAHGSGSVCGSNIAERKPTTLGNEKRLNPQLSLSRKEFIQHKINQTHEIPPYFKHMEACNVRGTRSLDDVKFPAALDAGRFKSAMEHGATVLDTRYPSAACGSHVPGSIIIWCDGIPSFAGWFLEPDQEILLVVDHQVYLHEALSYLHRIGYDNITGYLAGGFQSWYTSAFPVDFIDLITVQELHEALSSESKPFVLDVRREDEWENGHIDGATHVPVGIIEQHVEKLPSDEIIAIHCSIGYRATIAASILKKLGFTRLQVVLGSYKGWLAAGYPVTT
ncbi:MBL fold metallo-hydrolase [Candidatus Bathyarchaeota archaeon]|nr:MBL fold metallo-hydrolase [Candidatus Bathyarchaeota archaeon]